MTMMCTSTCGCDEDPVMDPVDKVVALEASHHIAKQIMDDFEAIEIEIPDEVLPEVELAVETQALNSVMHAAEA